jgi:hypothetical protein
MAVVMIGLDVRREFMVFHDNEERNNVLNSFHGYLTDYAVIVNDTFDSEHFDPWVGLPNIDVLGIDPGISYFELVVRSLWILVTLPFTICCHVVTWYMSRRINRRRNTEEESTSKDESIARQKPQQQDDEEEEDNSLGGAHMTVFMTFGIVIFCLGMVMIIAALIFKAAFSPFHLDSIEYIAPTFETVTNATPALMCGTEINHWNLVDFAILPVMLDLIPDNLFTSFGMGRIGGAYAQAAAGWDRDDFLAGGNEQDLVACENVYRYLFRLTDYPIPTNETDDRDLEALGGRSFLRDFGTESLFGLKHGALFRNGTESQSLIGYSGIRTPEDVGITLETVWTYWYREAMYWIIPYYLIIESVFLGSFWDALTEQIITLFCGPNRMSWRLASRFQADAAFRVGWANYYIAIEGRDTKIDHNLVYIGHGSSGLFVKGLAMMFHQYGVALESGQFDCSPPYGTFDLDDPAEFSLLNVYSGTSFLSMPEEAVRGNLMLPDVHSIWQPPNIYETFCVIAAGCISDDSFDNLCDQMVGIDTYKWYFDSWGRTRLDDPNAE